MTPEQFHARMWEILKPVDTKYFEVVAAPAPSAQAIADIEAAVGFPIPEEIIAFTRRANGLCVVAREEVWPAAKEFAVGPAWTFWRGLTLLGIEAPDLPEWASITAAHQRLVDNGVSGVLPLLKIFGNSDVWGINKTGTVVIVSDYEISPLTGSLLIFMQSRLKILYSASRIWLAEWRNMRAKEPNLLLNRTASSASNSCFDRKRHALPGRSHLKSEQRSQARRGFCPFPLWGKVGMGASAASVQAGLNKKRREALGAK